jgi:3-oxoacyl-[acyl-carrier-protein] synthase II
MAVCKSEGQAIMTETGAVTMASAARRAVITGFGVCTPLGRDAASFRAAILAGRDSIAPVGRYGHPDFVGNLGSAFPDGDVEFAVSGRARRWLDRTVWYTLHALDEALTHAGIDRATVGPERIVPERIAVVIGTSHAGLAHLEEIYPAVMAGDDTQRMLSVTVALLGAAVCRRVGALGPRISVSSACASSTNAMGVALDLIREGRADLVITGGADTLSLAVMAGFNSLRALSPHKTAPFSDPPGINLGEGAGILVVEPLNRAHRRGRMPVGEILGYGLSGDAHHATAPDPEGQGAERAMREALRDAGIAPDDIDYISTHGTGTDANDAAEATATLRVFGSGKPVSSPKSIFGHTLGASGVIETITTLLLADGDRLPPTVNFVGVRAGCPALDYVPNEPRPGHIDRFLCNNFGFGGNNASVVLSRTVGDHPAIAEIDETVVVTGLGAVTACGGTLADLADALWTGRSGLAADDELRAHVGRAPALRFTDAVLRPFARSSPMIKFTLQAVGEALGEAGDLVRGRGDAGLVMGFVTGAQRSTDKFIESVFTGTPALASAHHFPMLTKSATGGQVSIGYGLKGYISNFCGSASALLYVRDLIRRGRQTRVVAAAADELSARLLALFHASGCVQDDAAAPFDGGTGIAFGEGACALLLESAAAAKARGARPLAHLVAGAQTQDAGLRGVRADGVGLVRAMRQCLDEAGLMADAIPAVVAMGSGFGRAQAGERAAMAQVFGARQPLVTGLVGLTGYGPALSPMLHVAAGVLALQAGRVPACCGGQGGNIVTGEAVAVPGLDKVMVIATDITGLHSAVILTRPA